MSEWVIELINNPDCTKCELQIKIDELRSKIEVWKDCGFPIEMIKILEYDIKTLEKKLDSFEDTETLE